MASVWWAAVRRTTHAAGPYYGPAYCWRAVIATPSPGPAYDGEVGVGVGMGMGMGMGMGVA